MPPPLILVCDDSKSVAHSISVLLEREEYRVLIATNALECISVARRERPALILMDVMMPGIDGAAAAELMRHTPEFADTPLVLVSALPEEEVRARAEECGAAGYLAKPFTRATLLEAVKRHVAAPDRGIRPA